jgi:hypothetical protein
MTRVPLEKYRGYERQLVRVRWLHRGLHSGEEDEVLENMEAVWWELSDADRQLLESEPPKSLIRALAEVGMRVLQDRDVLADPQSVPRAEVA